MGYLEKAKQFISKNDTQGNYREVSKFLGIQTTRLSEFVRRNMALPVYSEIFQEEIWFCSNDSMVQKVRQDNPDAVCYTASELLELIKLNPSPVSLRKIHLTKTTFEGKLIQKCQNQQ